MSIIQCTAVARRADLPVHCALCTVQVASWSACALCSVHCASGELICLPNQAKWIQDGRGKPGKRGFIEGTQDLLYTRFVVHKGHKGQEKLHRTKSVSKRLERLYYWGWVLSHIPVQFSSSRQPHVSNEKVERGQNNNNGSIRWVGDGRG